MRKLFTALFLTVLSVATSASTNFSRQSIFAQNNNFTLQQLSTSDSLRVNLENTTNFEVVNDTLYFVRDGALHTLSLNNENEQVLSAYTQVSSLNASAGLVFFLSNNALNILSSENSFVAPSGETLPAQFNLISTYAAQNNIIFAGIVFNSSLEIYQLHIYSVSVTATFSQHKVINLSETAHPTALTLSDEYVYISFLNDQLYSVNIHSDEQASTSSLKTTKLVFAKIADKNLLLLVSSNGAILEVKEILEENSLQKLVSKTVEGNTYASFSLGDLKTITDAKIVNGEVWVLDNENKSLQTFTLTLSENSTLTPNAVVISTSAYAVGMFYKPQHLNALSHNKIIVTDTDNHRIQIISSNNTQLITHYRLGENSTKLTSPRLTLQNNNGHLIVYNKPLGLHEVLVLTQDGTLIKKINTLNEQPLPLLRDIAITQNNDLWALDAVNNALISSTNGEGFTTVTTNLFSEGIKSDAQIIATDTHLLVLNNNLHLFDTNGAHQFTLPTPIIKAITYDHTGNIFALGENQIIKYVITNNEIVENEVFSDIDTTNFKLLSVAPTNGDIMLYNSHIEQVFKLHHPQFSSAYANYIHPHDLTASEVLSSNVTIHTTNTVTFAFDLPNALGENYQIENGTKVFPLAQIGTYTYAAFNKENQLTTGYIKTSELSTQDTNAAQITLRVTVNNSKLLKYPSLTPTKTNTTTLVGNANLNTTLTAITQSFVGLDGKEYYTLQMPNGVAYVCAADVTTLAANEIQHFNSPNATTYNISGQTHVYQTINPEGSPLASLTNGTRIHVINYNSNTAYTQITFVNQNQQEIMGYVLTTNIKLNTWNEKHTIMLILVISGILLLTFTVSAYVIIKKKKEL